MIHTREVLRVVARLKPRTPGDASAFVVVLALACWSSPAAAQHALVGVAVGQDVHRFSSTPGPPVLDTAATSVRLSGGAFILPRWVVAVEAEWGREATVTRTTTVQLRGQTFDLETSHASRLHTIAAVTGVDVPAGARLRLRVLGGLAFARMERTIVSEAPPVVLGSPSAPNRTEYVDRFVTPVVGVDVAIVIGFGVTLVPALRAQGLHLTADLDGYSIRPSVGVNWSF